MNATIALLLGLSCLLSVSILLWAVFLRLGLRWARVEGVTKWQLLNVTLLTSFLQLLLTLGAVWVSSRIESLAILAAIVELMAAFVIPCFVIARSFRIKLWRAIKAWLPTLISSGAMLPLVVYGVRPHLFESFITPTNSMAPTLLGVHLHGSCAICGGPAFGSPDSELSLADGAPQMICEEHFHLSRVKDFSTQVGTGDRFLAAKFLRPQRWDLIVFRFPTHPETLYVKRLVGLPGEEIEIKDGAVWANGKRLDPPDRIHEIEYLSEMPGWTIPLWGSPERPARLGADEYFVLGDFSAAALDSRFWREGAPGHNAFAVPSSYLHGVVTHIYWPPSRWRVLH